MTSQQTGPDAEAAGPDRQLAELREQLDATDRNVMDIVAERLRICDQIGAVKQRYAVPMMQPGRVAHVTAAYGDHAVERGLTRGLGEGIAHLLIDEACRRETRIIDGGHA